jgi:hypothetical protein
MFGVDSWGDLGSIAVGGPLGLAGKKAYDKQQEGNDAQMGAMQQAQAQLAQLQKDQQARRQADLQRALGYFAPADALMNRMYGNQTMTTIAPGAMQSRTGPDHFGAHSGGGAPPPPPPSAAAGYFAPPSPPPNNYKLPTRVR